MWRGPHARAGPGRRDRLRRARSLAVVHPGHGQAAARLVGFLNQRTRIRLAHGRGWSGHGDGAWAHARAGVLRSGAPGADCGGARGLAFVYPGGGQRRREDSGRLPPHEERNRLRRCDGRPRSAGQSLAVPGHPRHRDRRGVPASPTIAEQRAVWRRHADLVVEYASDQMRLHELRKTLAWYSRGLYGGADLRRRAFCEPQPQAVIDLGESFFAALDARERARADIGEVLFPDGIAARCLARHRRRQGEAGEKICAG